MKKLVIIGVGMAIGPHMASLAALEHRAELSHVVTRSAARRDAFQKHYGFGATDDLDGAILDPSVDAVILLTPPDSHRSLGERILSAGKHLLIEKPAGLITDDTRFLADIAAAKGLLAAPVLQHRFRPTVRAAGAIIASQSLGRLCGANCLIPWWRPQSYYNEQGRGSLARDGGGVLLTQAIHTLDVLRALCGEVKIKAAQVGTSPLHSMEAEDMVCALAEFGPDAAPGTIMATTACYPGLPETVALIFEHATICLDGQSLQVFYHNGRSEASLDAGSSGGEADPMAFDHADHLALLTAFLDALEGKIPLMVDLSDLIKTREVIDQLISYRREAEHN